MESLSYQPPLFKQFHGELILAESTRLGGVSEGCYHSLNLGLNSGDKPAHITENRKRFAASLGFPAEQMASMHQIHEDKILRVHHPGSWRGYDALITNKKNVVLAVTIADCTPVLIYDPVQKAIGIAHAGWRGTVAQITAKTLLALRDAFGVKAMDCWAYIGSCIGAEDFEVGAEVARYFADSYKKKCTENENFLVDLKNANAGQLIQLGVPTQQIAFSPYSTFRRTDRYFSHRAENGKTGRSLAVIGLI